MEREQHIIQDAAEHYAVYVMQREAEDLGVATTPMSGELQQQFEQYLTDGGLSPQDFDRGKFRKYKANADHQLPAFVQRLSAHFPNTTLDFENVEKEYRNRGLKADFLLQVGGLGDPIAVSLKNYIGAGGILRPQVSSGTFASFAASFIFERVGVGAYADPRSPMGSFRGSDADTRDDVLRYLGRSNLIDPLRVLDQLQAEVREEFLGPDCEFYDAARVSRAARRVAAVAIDVVLELFERLGIDTVRAVLLARIGLDGKEEALFFDSDRYVDSITNRRYHDLRGVLNDSETEFVVAQHGQGIRFAFLRSGSPVLQTDVPFTINTNGAWYRPSQRYEGTQIYSDKGHEVELRWGQRRPYKSREIATSVNTYVDLARTGIFD